MKRLVLFSLSIFIGVCLIVASERRAWGYVDPGSGLLALQTIGSLLAGFGYFLRRRIRRLFVRPQENKIGGVPAATEQGVRKVA
ncbi:MAG TPA: hypothetical protein VGB94_10130 [Acidobacteriaceae bacterium]